MDNLLKIFTILALFSFSNACRVVLKDQALPFIFEETTENHTSGSRLPGEFKIAKKSWERVQLILSQSKSANSTNIAAKYIHAEIDEKSDCIQFYLSPNKTLREYRNEAWTPSLEYEFELSCGGDQSSSYIYMLGIKDENLYQPKFSDEHFQGELMYSQLNGYRVILDTVIKLVDADFNKQHANITISCDGLDCEYFDFKTNYLYFSQGHNYRINVTPKNVNKLRSIMENGKLLTMHINANDSVYKSAKSVQVDLLVSMNEEAFVGDDSNANSGSSATYLSLMISIGVVLAILLACSATVAYLAIRSRKTKDILRKLTETEIREFLEGNASFASAGRTRSVDVNTPIMALPYNHAFEIRRDKLRIDETTILGAGAFGVVWKGCVIYSNNDAITVAVKTVKRNVGILYFKALLSELKIMAYIGKHPNIVSLVGACTHNIRKREVYIALQYCANGNFHNYLKCRRDRFSNLVVDGKLQLANSAVHAYTYSTRGCFSKSISTIDLLKWSIQIANGLHYLESLGVIHGDLATRNVLIDSERTAKIADFGLSRRLIDYSNYYYTKTSQAPLPWKWMAPESLKDLRFSKKSDMWSFGIVLWEVFTLGQTPYPGLSWDESFVDRLEKGMRPTKPTFASDSIYEIMTDCWNLDPHDRPTIFDVKRNLENIMNSALRQKGDGGYMKFHGEQQSILRMINEDAQGYLQPEDQFKKTYFEA